MALYRITRATFHSRCKKTSQLLGRFFDSSCRYRHLVSGIFFLNGLLNFACPQAAGADGRALDGAADLDADVLEVGLAHLARAVVGVGDVAANQNTLIADKTFT